MSNIQKAFENGKAFIAFVTCGDPDLETTAKVVRAAVENGAIVGSAIIKLIEKYGADAPEYVAEYVKSMKDAIRSERDSIEEPDMLK